MCVLSSCVVDSKDDSARLMLWYNQPATEWVEALPVGNGRLGAMVFGGIRNERLQLNEDTLWAGPPIPEINYDAYENIVKAREAIFAGDYALAEKIISEKALSERIVPRSYQTLGDVHLHYKISDANATDYKRMLNLETAIAQTKFKIDGVTFTREIFCTAIDNVIVVHLAADRPKTLSLDVKLDRPADFNVVATGQTGLRLFGQISHAGKQKGVQYNCRLQAKISGGKIGSDSDGLSIENANSATLYISAATNLNNKDPFKPQTTDLAALCDTQIKQIIGKDYGEIKKAHIADYQRLFARVSIDLGDKDKAQIPTDKRLEAVKQGGQDLGLVALYFQYGRYMLISSSRPGSMAANLQGIWNDKIAAPWNADYHININMQMNYWLAEVCNLSECHEPFFDFIEALVPSGRETAKHTYKCRGFVAHHTTDPWHWTVPIGVPQYGMWPFGAAWSTQHFMERYRFTGDKDFLKNKALPIIRESALFMLDYLVEDPRTGKRVAGPASSPENAFLDSTGNSATVDMGASMSQEIIWDNFTNYLDAVELLGIEEPLVAEIKKARENLAMPKIGADGRLMEWSREFKEKEPGHRHISHLFGLHPGRQFTYEYAPDYMQACLKTIEQRLANGGGHTGWSRAWIINFWARLRKPENVYDNVQALLEKSTLPNLFDTHPPFQIDGNFGGTAGIAEALLQSHEDKVVLLPALPKQWNNGSIKGLIARGNFTVDIQWADGKLVKAKIKSNLGDPLKVSYGSKTEIFDIPRGKTITVNSELKK